MGAVAQGGHGPVHGDDVDEGPQRLQPRGQRVAGGGRPGDQDARPPERIAQWRPKHLILRVDRTDLSKNIVRGFLAYERLLQGHPELHGDVVFWAYLQPSRQDIDGGTVYVAPGLPRPNACARTPVCGYPPQTLHEIFDKVLAGQAKIIDGRHEIEDGLIIHPAFRGHTYGSQLLQVNTLIGQLVFGSDTYSSWEGIRDWQVANIQQTDTIQQMLAYEKCYALTSASPGTSATNGGFKNCISAHEPKSYSADYPITSNWWQIVGGNCSRAAELVLSNGEPTHRNGPQVYCETRLPPGTFGYQK